VHGGGRPTEALEAVLSPTRLVFFRGLLTQRFQSECSDVFQRLFFSSLEAYGLVQGRLCWCDGGAHWKREAGGPRKRAMFLVFTSSKCSSPSLRPFRVEPLDPVDVCVEPLILGVVSVI
jgi:hypothetical protein